jgi:hypothetical protein
MYSELSAAASRKINTAYSEEAAALAVEELLSRKRAGSVVPTPSWLPGEVAAE